MLDLTSILGILVTALSAWAIMRAVTRSRGVERTLAWIFAIIAFPGVGAVAYLLVANPRLRGTRQRRQLTTRTYRLGLAERTWDQAVEARPEVGSILRLAGGLTGLSATVGNGVDLLAGDEGAFAAMEEAIQGARRTIWAEYYIIRSDETGRRFMALLEDRARAGVEVRLLYDAVGTLRLNAKRLKALRRAGGRVEPFLPVNPLRRRWSVHLRNHRKLVIVDGLVAFTGGMNVGDEYSGRARRRGGEWFVDAHLRLQGPAVQDIAQTFAEDWAFATDENLPLRLTVPPEPSGRSTVAVVPSGPDQQPNANAMTWFSGIAGARSHCYITTPYFVPDEPTIQALASAALRGVDVRLMVPRRSDIPIARLAGRSYFPPLLKAGVRVFEYQPSMLHAKSMVVDGTWGLVGSANVDVRSFWLNFELSVLVADPDFATALEARFLQHQRDSVETTMEDVWRRSLAERFVDGTARLLSPLL